MEAVMLKRSLLVLGLVGLMSSYASAQVFVEYWDMGEGGPDGNNDKTVIDQGETLTLGVGVSGGSDLVMAAADFAFAWPTGLSMSNWAWDPQFDEGLGWVLDNTTAAPALSSVFPTADIPAGPNPVLMLATVDLTAAGDAPVGNTAIDVSSFTNPNLPTINDGELAEYTVDAGSGSIPVEVTPEPATLALLALGGLTALRRRRS
jgi:MYXO-CTERM domain-containing protein